MKYHYSIEWYDILLEWPTMQFNTININKIVWKRERTELPMKSLLGPNDFPIWMPVNQSVLQPITNRCKSDIIHSCDGTRTCHLSTAIDSEWVFNLINRRSMVKAICFSCMWFCAHSLSIGWNDERHIDILELLWMTNDKSQNDIQFPTNIQ